MKDEMIKDYFLQCSSMNIFPSIKTKYNGYISEYVANIRVSGLYIAQKLYTSETEDDRRDVYDGLVALIGAQNMTNEDYRVRIECACAAMRLYVDSRGGSA